jgi:hypothetical protein
MVAAISKVSPISRSSAINSSPAGSREQTPDRTLLNSDAFDPLNGLNIEQWNLSFADQLKIQMARIQFGLSYQVMNALHTLQGQDVSAQNLFSSSSYDFLKTIAGQIKVSIPTASSPASSPPSPPNTAGSATDGGTTTAQTAQDGLTKLRDYFSPENTAQRILEIAIGFFPLRESAPKETDTEATRQAFSEFIGGAIDQGFRQARQHLWDLPGDIQNGLDQTHSLIMDGLSRFVQGDIAPESTDVGAILAKIGRFHQEATQVFRQIRMIFSPSDYNAQGGLDAISVATFTKTG